MKTSGLRRAERTELTLLLFFLTCWVVFCVHALIGYPLAGTLRIGLYHLYGLAASGGWLLGNLEVGRERRFERRGGDPLPAGARRRLHFLNMLAPAGVIFLIWSLAPRSMRVDFPMVPLYATGMLALFFLVPVSLKRVFDSK